MVRQILFVEPVERHLAPRRRIFDRDPEITCPASIRFPHCGQEPRIIRILADDVPFELTIEDLHTETPSFTALFSA